MDEGLRQPPGRGAGGCAIPPVKRPRDLSFIPPLGIIDLGQAEIIRLAPEERNLVEALVTA